MTLEDHLFQQLFWEISDPLKREIGNFIIGNLDKDGFLHLTCEEIAETLNINRCFYCQRSFKFYPEF